MKYKNILFSVLAVVVIAVAAFFLFGKDVINASALGKSDKYNDVAEEYIVDGKFTKEDIAEWSPLGDHKDYLPVEKYAGYCKDLQTSGRYSTNVYTNAFLSMKRYIAPEEVPTYDKFLKDAPTSSDPRTIVMNTIAKNWQDHPELNSYGDMVMKVAAACN